MKDALGYFEHWYDVPKGLREAIGDGAGAEVKMAHTIKKR